jgi:hypothetical protein
LRKGKGEVKREGREDSSLRGHSGQVIMEVGGGGEIE